MSYIDTFDNEFVGYFGGIPVYHPLEVVPASPDDPAQFACGPDNLVIGGGSGEWPGLVVKDAGETVACFVRAWLRWQEQNCKKNTRSFGRPWRHGRTPPRLDKRAATGGASLSSLAVRRRTT